MAPNECKDIKPKMVVVLGDNPDTRTLEMVRRLSRIEANVTIIVTCGDLYESPKLADIKKLENMTVLLGTTDIQGISPTSIIMDELSRYEMKPIAKLNPNEGFLDSIRSRHQRNQIWHRKGKR
jgi:predicted phosphodiesterase